MCPHGVSVPIELEGAANDEACKEQYKLRPSLESVGHVFGNFRSGFGKGLLAKLKGEKPVRLPIPPIYQVRAFTATLRQQCDMHRSSRSGTRSRALQCSLSLRTS